MTCWTADFEMVIIALFTILLRTSPIPIGLTPGDLSRVINLHAVKAVKPDGCTYEQHRRRANEAIASQRSWEHFLKDDRSRFHAEASRPDGPAAPLIFRAIEWINGPFICS